MDDQSPVHKEAFTKRKPLMHSEPDLSDIWDNVLMGRYPNLSQINREDRAEDGKQILSFTDKDKAYAYERHSPAGAWKPVTDMPAKIDVRP
jgi:hypothetical protein